MALSLVSLGTESSALSGNLTPGIPAGCSTDDLLVLFLQQNDNVTSTFPVDWIQGDATNNGASLRTAWMWKLYDGSEGSNVTVTHTAGGACRARIAAFSGHLAVPGNDWIYPTTTDANDGSGYYQHTSYPPSGGTFTAADSDTIWASKSSSGADYFVDNGFLRFDTSSVPNEAVIIGASIILHVISSQNESGDRSLEAEIYDFGGEATTSADWAAQATSPNGTLTLGSVVVGELNGITLDVPDTIINKSGFTNFRLTVSGGVPGAGQSNDVEIAASEHTTHPAPMLAIQYYTPFAQTSVSANASSSTITASTITPTADDYVIFFAGHGTAAGTVASYSGTDPTFSEQFDSASGVEASGHCMALGSSTGAATGSRTATITGGASTNTGYLIAIRDEPPFSGQRPGFSPSNTGRGSNPRP